MDLYIDKEFENIDYSGQRVLGEYENCSFKRCNFSGSDLSGVEFIDCTFSHCNLTLAVVAGTQLKSVRFVGCKLSGVEFGGCNKFLFSVTCTDCQMNSVSFLRNKMPKHTFKDCLLRESIFVECDLQGAKFDNCDLGDTLFERNNLQKADFVTSFNYTIDPENNRMKKARFSADGALGLLAKYEVEIER